MAEFRMPSLGADMDVGTIIEWLVQPGDTVKRGQIVAVVDTAKAAIEIEAFADGVLEEILVGPGVQVPVGTPLAMIGPVGVVDSAHPVGRIDDAGTAVGAGAASEVGAGAAGAAHPRATPPVRHLAHQLGVDLEGISGSGADGHITHDDVLAAAALAPTGSGSAAGPTAPPAGPATPAAPTATTTAAPPSPAPPTAAPEGRLRVTPRARRLAAERGIDLAAVTGTGAGGAVTGTDVEHAPAAAGEGAAASAPGTGQAVPGAPAPAAPAPAAPAPGVPAPGATARTTAAASLDRKAAMRTAIANLMSRSNAEIPHYYVTQTMDLAAALAWLRAHNAELPAAKRLLPAVLFLRATVLAALAVPDLNGHWVDGALRPADRVDLGVAVATRGGGLVTPAIPDAGPLGVDELMARLADLVGRARRGKLKQSEMAGASITVSSLGESGPDALYGVIFPPQVALVGVGGIVERPWAVGGMLTVRPTVTIALAADHRASDGRTASAFLATFAHALQNPEEL
jgi:pyruvate dehydrogenase E2 component (dihydrolipoamide acetyltransferase)